MRQLLARVDDDAAWEVGPVPGLYLTHFQPGPRLSSVDAGFVRVTAGQTVPPIVTSGTRSPWCSRVTL